MACAAVSVRCTVQCRRRNTRLNEREHVTRSRSAIVPRGRGTLSSGQALLNDGEKSYTYDQANRLTTSARMAWPGAHLQRRRRAPAPSDQRRADHIHTRPGAVAAPLVQVLAQQDAAGTTTHLYGGMRIGEQQPGGVPPNYGGIHRYLSRANQHHGRQWSFADGVTGTSRISSFTIGPISAVADSPRAR